MKPISAQHRDSVALAAGSGPQQTPIYPVVLSGGAAPACGRCRATAAPSSSVTRFHEKPGRIPLDLIEIQSGPYLGEDDVVRLEDLHARAPDE